MNETIAYLPGLSPVENKKLCARFDGGRLSSDGGGLLLRGIEKRLGLVRFETEVLATDENLATLTDLSGQWIYPVHDRRPPTRIILDMDSSVSPTRGDDGGGANPDAARQA